MARTKTQETILMNVARVAESKKDESNYTWSKDRNAVGIPCRSIIRRKAVEGLIEAEDLTLVLVEDEIIWVRPLTQEEAEQRAQEGEPMPRHKSAKQAAKDKAAKDKTKAPKKSRARADLSVCPPNASTEAVHEGQPACLCGCGYFPRNKKSRFIQGHDARFAGSCRRVIAGEADAEDLKVVTRKEVAAAEGLSAHMNDLVKRATKKAKAA